MQTVIIIVGVVSVLSVVAFVVYRLISRRKIIKDGIQVEAVLQRVEEHESRDTDGNTSSTYTFGLHILMIVVRRLMPSCLMANEQCKSENI